MCGTQGGSSASTLVPSLLRSFASTPRCGTEELDQSVRCHPGQPQQTLLHHISPDLRLAARTAQRLGLVAEAIHGLGPSVSSPAGGAYFPEH
jgi:hypothetical protein